jgi:hypothetical protein
MHRPGWSSIASGQNAPTLVGDKGQLHCLKGLVVIRGPYEGIARAEKWAMGTLGRFHFN